MFLGHSTVYFGVYRSVTLMMVSVSSTETSANIYSTSEDRNLHIILKHICRRLSAKVHLDHSLLCFRITGYNACYRPDSVFNVAFLTRNLASCEMVNLKALIFCGNLPSWWQTNAELCEIKTLYIIFVSAVLSALW